MKYISTRGNAPELNFEQVLLTGLATDGGLYVPASLPEFSADQISSWAGLAYHELAFEIVSPFVGDCIPDDDLRAILAETYKDFAHPAIAPLIQLDRNEWILELFQGPTLAFKDFALQLLGRLLDYFLKKRNQRVVIMGATSGDTGSAAIEGCRRCDNIDIFILHPHNRVSDVQRRQMTTVLEDNVYNIAIEGNFDDCQDIVKASFRDQSFLPDGMQLVAVNSINWARIMAQIVYYFYAGLSLGSPAKTMAFSVPTGNFGDIFAGYLAKKMGLPISQLVIATNKNNVLHRVMTDSVYSRTALHQTLSPSMDISVSSNFERLLFDLYNRDGDCIRNMMEAFNSESIELNDDAMASARELFSSASIDDAATCDIISKTFNDIGYMLDPHSATGVGAGRLCNRNIEQPMVVLATAHPAKFPDAIEQSNIGVQAIIPPHLGDLFEREERFTVLPCDKAVVNTFMFDQL
ncbi:MAG TPA: threonine synthase [Cellvibrionales bacterium]|nr:threonine synthase [Cellvibrionales bacterium]